MHKKILFDEQGIHPGSPFKKGQWKEIATHDENSIKGFFGDYRFLSNFWPASVSLDEDSYSCVENAYQAAKYPKEKRDYFKHCQPKEAISYTIENPPDERDLWDIRKLDIMRSLLRQKFDKSLNPDLYKKLQETENKYLEETNYWEDNFWGVSITDRSQVGKGENNLGKLLMEIRRG